MVDLTLKFGKIIKTLPKPDIVHLEKKNENSQINEIFNSFSSDLVFFYKQTPALPILVLF